MEMEGLTIQIQVRQYPPVRIRLSEGDGRVSEHVSPSRKCDVTYESRRSYETAWGSGKAEAFITTLIMKGTAVNWDSENTGEAAYMGRVLYKETKMRRQRKWTRFKHDVLVINTRLEYQISQHLLYKSILMFFFLSAYYKRILSSTLLTVESWLLQCHPGRRMEIWGKCFQFSRWRTWTERTSWTSMHGFTTWIRICSITSTGMRIARIRIWVWGGRAYRRHGLCIGESGEPLLES